MIWFNILSDLSNRNLLGHFVLQDKRFTCKVAFNIDVITALLRVRTALYRSTKLTDSLLTIEWVYREVFVTSESLAAVVTDGR